MRRRFLGIVAWSLFLLPNSFVRAQSSIDILDEELKAAKEQHQEMTSQTIANFFSQVDAAMGSSDAAVSLYQLAGGLLPDPSPVITQHASETVSERAAREALDQAAVTKLGTVLQLHCGLMHFGGLFVVDPKRAGLQDQWVAWLQKAAPVYDQLGPLPEPVRGAGNPGVTPPFHHHRMADPAAGGAPNAAPPPKPMTLSELKAKALQDSIISKYLSFKNWGAEGQGGWAVQDLPRLYRANVLDPLRVTPSDATLAAWDVYIGMMNADVTDNGQWSQTDYPPLQFERAYDDYTIAPSTEKLEGLIKIVNAVPTHAQADDWIARIHKLLDDYRAHHGGSAIASESSGPATATTKDPNVTISTEQQGDATIITTHTNTAPVNPAPPAH